MQPNVESTIGLTVGVPEPVDGVGNVTNVAREYPLLSAILNVAVTTNVRIAIEFGSVKGKGAQLPIVVN